MNHGKIFFFLEKKTENSWSVCNEFDFYSPYFFYSFGGRIPEIFWNCDFFPKSEVLADFYKRGLPERVSGEVKQLIEDLIQSSVKCNLSWIVGWATIDELLNIDYDRPAGGEDYRYVPREFAQYFICDEKYYGNPNMPLLNPWPLQVPEEYRFCFENKKSDFVEVHFQPTFKDIFPYFFVLLQNAKQRCGDCDGRILFFVGV